MSNYLLSVEYRKQDDANRYVMELESNDHDQLWHLGKELVFTFQHYERATLSGPTITRKYITKDTNDWANLDRPTNKNDS